jgi:phosphoglycerol transferase MdoB-like AlkP superfamily enzyme
MFRIAVTNSQRQFSLGDNKAHILITVNSIIMSIIVSVMLRKLAENPFLTWPTFILLGTSVVSIIFAILATRPKIDAGTFSQADLDSKNINLLYFGNFNCMPVSEYIHGMQTVMADQEFIYRTLILDAYWHGIVLRTKYSFLRKAYNAFLYGLIISIAGFVVAFLMHH